MARSVPSLAMWARRATAAGKTERQKAAGQRAEALEGTVPRIQLATPPGLKARRPRPHGLCRLARVHEAPIGPPVDAKVELH